MAHRPSLAGGEIPGLVKLPGGIPLSAEGLLQNRPKWVKMLKKDVIANQ